MRVIWLTNLHLNFVEDEYEQAALAEEIRSVEADAVLVGGDIGEADSFAGFLYDLAATVQTPVYFVLGNHDYYRGSISEVRETDQAGCAGQARSDGQSPESGIVHSRAALPKVHSRDLRATAILVRRAAE